MVQRGGVELTRVCQRGVERHVEQMEVTFGRASGVIRACQIAAWLYAAVHVKVAGMEKLDRLAQVKTPLFVTQLNTGLENSS